MNLQKSYSVDEAQKKLEFYCSYQERCHKEVYEKLKSMRMIPDAIDIIIEIAKNKKLATKSASWNLSDKKLLTNQIKQSWQRWKFGSFNPNSYVTRIQFAQLMDATINPFELQEIDHNGKIKSIY